MKPADSAEAIENEALAWVARLDREGHSAALEADLGAWLAADPRRRGAYLRAEAIWLKLDRASLSAAAPPARRPRGTLSRRLAVGGAGGALAAGLAGLWLGLGEDTYATGLGEVRHVALADGSTADVNTESRVRIAMGRDLRRVRLVSGEAWFRVAKDPARPFVVEAGRVRVRAVGTAFAVRRLPDGAEISVTEGVVEAWIAGAPAGRSRIAAGRMARVVEAAADRGAIAVRPAEAAEIDRKLAWRAGKIEFDGETLTEALADFNRYNARKLRLAEPALAGKRLHGVFRTDDPEGFARSAAVVFGGRVEAYPDEIVILAGA